MAWVQATKDDIATVLDGQGKGVDCPSSAIKPALAKPAPANPQPAPKNDSAEGEEAAEDEDEKPDEFASLNDDKEAEGAAATGLRTQPARDRGKPERLGASPEEKKGKGSRKRAARDAAEGDEGVKKSGRGQRSGPRGQNGMPMKYKKRTAAELGKGKSEGEPRTQPVPDSKYLTFQILISFPVSVRPSAMF